MFFILIWISNVWKQNDLPFSYFIDINLQILIKKSWKPTASARFQYVKKLHLWKRFHKTMSTRETFGHTYPRISARTVLRLYAFKTTSSKYIVYWCQRVHWPWTYYINHCSVFHRQRLIPRHGDVPGKILYWKCVFM